MDDRVRYAVVRQGPQRPTIARLPSYFVAVVIAVAGAAPGVAGDLLGARDLRLLADIGGYWGNISVSPDGTKVAFQLQVADFAKHAYKIDWYVVPLAGSHTPVHVGDGGDVILAKGPLGRTNGDRDETKAKWSPDGSWIAYLRRDGAETQVWRSRANGSQQQQVTHAAGEILEFNWMPRASGVGFKVGGSRVEATLAEEREADHGFLLDERFSPDYSHWPLGYPCGARSWEAPSPSAQRCSPMTWVVDFSAQPIRERMATAAESFDLEGGAQSTQTSRDANEQGPTQPVWNAKRSHRAWLKNETPLDYPGEDAPLRLYRDSVRCPAPQCQGRFKQPGGSSNLWWNGNEVIFLRYEGQSESIPALYAWRPRGPVALIYRFDGVLQSCEMGKRVLICLQETPTTPRKIVSINLSTGEVATLFDPNPQFPRFRLGAVERLEWSDSFGNDAFGHLVYPPSYIPGRQYPLVIVQYWSRGFLRGGVGDEFPIFPLAAAGFLVLSYDRPTDRSISARCQSDTLEHLASCLKEDWKDDYRYRRKLSGLEVILDKLQVKGIVDSRRIGITGLSEGAETVDYGLIHSTRFTAAATSGWFSQQSYYDTDDYWRLLRRASVGARDGADFIEKTQSVSISYHAQAINVPLLMQVSDVELIPLMADYVALKEAGKPVEAYVFPNEYHIKWQPQHKLAVAERTIDWFRFWLQGYEDADPAKAEQYRRWEGLCVLHATAMPDGPTFCVPSKRATH
jgi:dipeptidyl aminopeptidase/acylaminoacyl peptidase